MDNLDILSSPSSSDGAIPLNTSFDGDMFDDPSNLDDQYVMVFMERVASPKSQSQPTDGMDEEFDDLMIEDKGLKFEYDKKLFDNGIFSTMKDLKFTLMEYAIDGNFSYKVEEARGQEVYVVKCAHSMCKWRLSAVGHGASVRVSQFDTKHMYGGLKRAKDSKHATYFWIERKCLGLYDNPVKYTIQVIQDHICKVNVSYKKAWMVKNIL